MTTFSCVRCAEAALHRLKSTKTSSRIRLKQQKRVILAAGNTCNSHGRRKNIRCPQDGAGRVLRRQPMPKQEENCFRGTNLRAATCCATPQGCSAHHFRSPAALLVPCNTKVNSIHSSRSKSARKASQPREAPAPHVQQRVAAASIRSYCDGCRVLTAAFCELDCARQRYTTWPWAVTFCYANLLNTSTPFPPTYCWCYRCQADHPCYNPRRTWCPLH